MTAYKTSKTATEIAEMLTAAGYTYYGLKPKAWEGNTQARIYFGQRHYLTVIDGTCTSIKPGRCSAHSINDEAVEAVAEVIAKAEAVNA